MLHPSQHITGSLLSDARPLSRRGRCHLFAGENISDPVFNHLPPRDGSCRSCLARGSQSSRRGQRCSPTGTTQHGHTLGELPSRCRERTNRQLAACCPTPIRHTGYEPLATFPGITGQNYFELFFSDLPRCWRSDGHPWHAARTSSDRADAHTK